MVRSGLISASFPGRAAGISAGFSHLVRMAGHKKASPDGLARLKI
jgi:hypothetical protein